MPPDMAIDMRHTKLKPEEAALLAGELKKPSWQSRNEGIHERVSFEDAIWGFDLAGGSYYKTPLRVVSVKPDSRAEKAGIRAGDRLKRINDIETSTLTIQEAHQIIIDSGVHLRLAVTAPEDEEDAYFCYEDPVENGYDSDEERRLLEERVRKREVHAKVSSYWSLQWPWVSKRRVIYRESNCFMVPSKFEDKHRDKFSAQPMLRVQDDIVLQSAKNEKYMKEIESQSKLNENESPIVNGNQIEKPNQVLNDNPPVVNGNHQSNDVDKNNNQMTNGDINGKENGVNGNLDEIPEVEEESIQEDVSNSQNDDLVSESQNEEVSNSQDDEIINEILGINDENVPKGEEDNIPNSVLSDGDEQSVENSESIDER